MYWPNNFGHINRALWMTPVLDEEPSVLEVCSSLDIGPTALSRSIDQVCQERQGSTPAGAKTITSDKLEIQELKALLR
ncbi:hypothetical protein ACOYXF_09910 [Pseudomonas sp. Tul1A2]